MSRSLAALSLLAAGGIGLAALAPPGVCGDGDYVVVRGDTLGRIARRCGSTVAAIAAASRIANPNLILVGQRLVIPGGEAFARRVTRPTPAPATDAAGRLTYAMTRGDTLYSLARWSRVSLPALLAANPGVDPRAIEIGDVIRLPNGAARPQLARARERGPLPRVARPAPVVRDAPVPRATPRPAPRRDEEPDPIGM